MSACLLLSATSEAPLADPVSINLDIDDVAGATNGDIARAIMGGLRKRSQGAVD